jgi:O-antigen/teichoic acid export membrane protein
LLIATLLQLRAVRSESIQLAWLLADQGIFASTNFITNILFARWLTPIDYGMFAVSFTGYLLLTVFHFGAVLEPLLVQSSRVDSSRSHSYIVTLIRAHVIAFAGIGILVLVGFSIASFIDARDIGLAIIGAGIGGSFMVTLLTARRLCLVFLSTRVSTMIGALYMAGVIITSYLIHAHGGVTWFDLWLVMGGWSLLCSVLILRLLYVSLRGTNPYTLAELVRFQWQYARYGMVAALCAWMRVDGIMLILAKTAGLEVIAETRAIMNIGNPIVQVVLALQPSWLVRFSRQHSMAILGKTLLVFCLGAGIVLAVVTGGYETLVRWVYGGRYMDGAWLLPLYFFGQSLNGTENIFTSFLKAIGSLRRGYTPQIVGSILSVILALSLIPTMGETAFIAIVVATFATGTILAAMLVMTRNVVG